MKDAERIYALYVQANPVPNPDLLPLTRDDAVLLSIEGSEDMQTQEPIKEQPAVRNTSRNVLVAAGAFAVVIAASRSSALQKSGRSSVPHGFFLRNRSQSLDSRRQARLVERPRGVRRGHDRNCLSGDTIPIPAESGHVPETLS